MQRSFVEGWQKWIWHYYGLWHCGGCDSTVHQIRVSTCRSLNFDRVSHAQSPPHLRGSQVNTKQINCPRIVTIVNHYYNPIYLFFSGEPYVLKHFSSGSNPHAKFCTSGSPLFVSQKIGMEPNAVLKYGTKITKKKE